MVIHGVECIIKLINQEPLSCLTKKYVPNKVQHKEILPIKTDNHNFLIPKEVQWIDLFSLSKKLGLKIVRGDSGEEGKVEGDIQDYNDNEGDKL